MKKNKNANYLDLIPVWNETYHREKDETGIVTIYIENTGMMNRIMQKLLGKPKVTQVHLDETGSFVAPLIDGERSVYDIAQLVKERFGEKAEPLYDRLVTYMHTLERSGFVTMK